MKPVCIVRNSDGAVLARATRADQFLEQNGNWYFHPDTVNLEYLEVSDRVHDCPTRGRRFWVDGREGGRYVNDIAWTYPEPKPEYRKIAGWFGFYGGHRSYRKTDCD